MTDAREMLAQLIFDFDEAAFAGYAAHIGPPAYKPQRWEDADEFDRADGFKLADLILAAGYSRPAPLDDARLREIEARLIGITDDPWCVDDHVMKAGDIGEDWAVFEQREDDPPIVRCSHWRQEANARFIAGARQDIPYLLTALSAERERRKRAERERDEWIETSAHHHGNEEYYRGLVVRIGETFGREAYVSDDGSVQQDVICANVPELAEAAKRGRDRLRAAAELDRAIANNLAQSEMKRADEAEARLERAEAALRIASVALFQLHRPETYNLEDLNDYHRLAKSAYARARAALNGDPQ